MERKREANMLNSDPCCIITNLKPGNVYLDMSSIFFKPFSFSNSDLMFAARWHETSLVVLLYISQRILAREI